MNKTDWRWCLENPKEAAAEIDRLTRLLDAVLKERDDWRADALECWQK